MKSIALIVCLFLVWETIALAQLSEREQKIQECMEHLRIIGEAIKEYKAEHQDQSPNWLSELCPKYLKDAKILLCPADETGSTKYFITTKDPALPCSYFYEFNPQPEDVHGIDFATKIPKDDTWRKRRTRQLRYFGGLVSVVQCWHHGRPGFSFVIDLNYRGEVYRSAEEWEKNYASENAVLKFLRETIARNPIGWEQEISLSKLYDYLWSRRGELRSVLETQRPPLSKEVLKTIGKIYDKEGNTEQALRIYRQLVQSTPDDVESRLRLAQLLAAQKKYQEALAQCRGVIQSKSDERRAYTLLAQIYAAMDESHAQARLEEILKEAEAHKTIPPEGLPDDLRHNYLLRFQQSLLSKESDLKSVVKNAQKALKERFDQPATPDLMANIVETLNKSVRKSQQWKTYSTSDGLSNNYVYSIAQDSKGYLWFVTGAGVSRYDGRTFTDVSMPDGMAENDIFIGAVLADRQGNLWFGTTHGVIRYDGKSFTSLTVADGLTHQNVSCLLEDKQGNLWFGTFGNGVSRYDGNTFKNLTTHDGLAENTIHSIMEDREGNIWFGTWGEGGGVSKYDGQRFTNFTESGGLAGNIVRSMAKDDEGMLWFGTDKGVSRYDGKTFTTFTTKDGLAQDFIVAILKDIRGNLWFAFWQGVSWYDGEIFHTLTQEDGLADNHIYCMYEDREGHLWFGHNFAGGVSKFNPQSCTNFSVQDGLAENSVLSLFEDRQGNIWIGTKGGGVSKYDGRQFINFTKADGLSGNVVTAIREDNQGYLWFGTNGGVSQYDGKSFTTFTTHDGLIGNLIWVIVQDRKGILWFGEVNKGISRYDGNSFTNLTVADGLAYNGIRCFLEDSKGNLWIGTWHGGVSRYDGETFTNYTESEGLVDNSVLSMLEDSQGRVWIGTAAGVSQGELSMETDNGGSKSFKTVPELAGKYVAAIAEDRNGRLWFGIYGGGVVKYDGKIFSILTTADGLASDAVECILEDSRGRLWFGSGLDEESDVGEGVSLHIPSAVPPLVHIQRVTADKVYDNPETVGEIPASVGHVNIAYHGISFKTRPGQMQYIYQLEGQDNDWNLPTKEESVDYLDLKPGTYTFSVKAIDRDLNYSEPASLTLKVVPPFYLSAGFLAPTVGGGTLLLTVLVFQAIVLIKRRRQVRAYERAAVKELQDAHEMQMALMPETAPAIEGVDIAGKCVPANTVSGDFFDYLESKNQSEIGLVVADVSGKALKGAMNAVMADGILHSVAKNQEKLSPAFLMMEINDVLKTRMEQYMNVTMVIAVIHRNRVLGKNHVLERSEGSVSDGETILTLANAAHHAYPLLLRNEKVQTLRGGGLPLGMRVGIEYTEEQLSLESRDVVILMTDGIIEAQDSEEQLYSDSGRLEEVISQFTLEQSAESMVDAILSDAMNFGGDKTTRDDDMTVVVAKLQ